MNLYKGTFNWYGEVHVLYTGAKCQNRALGNFISRLARELGRTRRSIQFYFLDENESNWEIKEVR